MAVVLCAFSVLAMVLAISIRAQSGDESEKLIINVDHPLGKPYQIRFRTAEQAKSFVELQSSSNKIWFISRRLIDQEASDPGALTIKITGKIDGYNNNERLEMQKWYPFKNRLPLTFEWESSQKKPSAYQIQLGELADNDQSVKSIEDARKVRSSAIRPLLGKVISYSLVDYTTIFDVTPTQFDLSVNSENKSPAGNIFELKQIVKGPGATWAFFRIKNSLAGLIVDLDEVEDNDSSTAEVGMELEPEQWYGFKGTLRLKATLPQEAMSGHGGERKLSIEGGEASEPVNSKQEATKAESSDSIRQKGPVTTVTVIVKKTSQPDTLDRALAFLGENWAKLLLGLFILMLIVSVGFRLLARRAQKQPENFAGDTAGAGDTVRADLYDYDPRPRPPATLVYGGRKPPSTLERLTSWLPGRRSPLSAEEESEIARQRQRQREALERERGLTGSDASSSGPSEHGHSRNDLREQTVVTQFSSAQPSYNSNKDGAGLNPAMLEKINKHIDDKFESLTSRSDWRSLSHDAEAQVKRMIEHYVNRNNERERKETESRINQQKKLLEDQIISLNEQTSKTVIQVRDELNDKLGRISKAQDSLSEQAGKDRQALCERLGAIEQKIEALAQAQQTNERFVAQCLGLGFGHAVPELQEREFTSAVDQVTDSLNNFFKTGVPPAEIVDELLSRTKTISSGIRTVVDRAVSIRPDVIQKFDRYKARAETLVSELNTMQAQLQSRQLVTANFNFKIPVASHSVARYTFLQELGLAVKREIDKWRDPQNYFQHDVERLATADVIAVADICDREVTTGPGSNGELESALRDLFKSANLKSILPAAKEPFEPKQQNLIQIVSGPNADSQKIASVESRGFSYDDDDKTLIRKAGVKVYR